MAASGRPIVPSARVQGPVASGFIRARLHNSLDGVQANQLGLVVAPIGSGKTTLLARWAQDYPGLVAWYRADAADARHPGLAQCLAAALHRVIAPPPDREHVHAAGPSMSVEDIALIVEGAEKQVMLVVDDVHELAGTPAIADLEHLLLIAPANLHVVLSSRTMPSINLARTEIARPLVVVGDDLRFRSWEVEGLFRDYYAEPLAPDDAAALARRTEGWAAALQLFHLATRGREYTARSRAVSSLTGRSRYAQDYLSGQLLDGLPADLRELMLRTCVFDLLTGARCDALLGGVGGQRALEELERRQALTTSDDGGATFRYHEVLRRHLEAALFEDLGEADTHAWYRAAAEILEQEGAIAEALRARCRAADWENARRLLREDGQRIVDAHGSDWAELLPPWLTRGDPWVALAEARHLLDDGQFEAADRAARSAAEQFTDPLGQDLCRSVVRTAATWMRGPQQVDRRWADVLRAATQRNPLAQVDRAQELDSPFAQVVEGAALLLAGDAQGAAAPLRRRAAKNTDDPRAALTARLLLVGLTALFDGRPSAAQRLDEICLDADRLGYTWLVRMSRGLALARATTPGDVQAAADLALDCAERGDPWAAALIRSAIAFGRLRRGEPDIAHLEALIEDFRALDAGVMEAWTRCVRALAIAFAEHPEAEQEIRAAESFARSAGAVGALALAYAGLAEVRGDDGGELRQLVDAIARSTGLEVQPWRWLQSKQRPVAAPTPPTEPGGPSPSKPSSAPVIELSCFGPFQLKIDGYEPKLSSLRPRARTLLRLLALGAGEPVHRDRIADTLWADLGREAAMHNLHVTISSLRKMLRAGSGPGSLIARDGDSYLLVLHPNARSDVRDFEAHRGAAMRAKAAGDTAEAAAALNRALECYAGDLLPEEGTAEWVVEARQRYRTQAAEAAATLAELERSRGYIDAAATAAAWGVHIDNCHDGSWRALIQAHRMRGDLAAAEQAQRAYRDMLRTLGVADPPDALR